MMKHVSSHDCLMLFGFASLKMQWLEGLQVEMDRCTGFQCVGWHVMYPVIFIGSPESFIAHQNGLLGILHLV